MNENQTDFIQKYNYKNSEAFKKMEELACKLVLENQDLNLLSKAKIFKEKASSAIKNQNSTILKSFDLKEITKTNDLTKFDIRVQYDKYRAVLEKEQKRNDVLTKNLEEMTKEYLNREIELNTLIYHQTEVFE